MKTCERLLFVLLIAVSCQNNKDAGTSSTAKNDTLTHPSSIIVIKSNDSVVKESFSGFWKRFRTAVINTDTTQIISITKFPFQTRGPLDSDPTIKYPKEMFTRVFTVFLNQWNGIDLEGKTELYSIKRIKNPDIKDVHNDYTRVGELVFAKTSKGWKLVFAYLNNETTDSLKK